METLLSVSEDALGIILKQLDIKSTIKLLTSSKILSKKVTKYVYPRLWFNYKDLKKEKYKKEDYIYIQKIIDVTDLNTLKEFKNVKKIIFNNDFNQEVNKLPLCVTHLTFGNDFNQEVDKLPLGVTHLTFGDDFNQNVDNLPPSLTHLIFGGEFNQKVNILPSSLLKLTFGHIFDQKVDQLPPSLTHITFGFDFNQKVNNLPSSLTHITFGFCSLFNQSVDRLPRSLILFNNNSFVSRNKFQRF